MTSIATISVGSRQIGIHSASGEVMGSRKWATTEISGGGGSGVISRGSGIVEIDEVKSKTTTHDQLVIRTPDGKEEALKVEDLNLAVRDGHWVSLIRAIPDGWQKGPVVAVVNHATGAVDIIDSAIKEVCGTSPLGYVTIALLLIGLYICFQAGVGAMPPSRLLLGLLLMAPCPIYYVRLIRRLGAFKKQLAALCEQVKTSQAPPAAAATPAPA